MKRSSPKKRFWRPWALGVLWILATMSPANTVAQDVASAFSLHEEPKVLANVEFEDGDGQLLSLKTFRGRFILLNIWATWCGPCRHEMPTLDRLQAELGGSTFEVVALSIDRAGIEVVRKFYAEMGLEHLAIYIDSTGKAAPNLGAIGLPTTLLIDRNGKEIGRLTGPAEWDTPEMIAFLKSHAEDTTGLMTPPQTSKSAKIEIACCRERVNLSPRPSGGGKIHICS